MARRVMSMDSFPRWSGPVVGALVGAWVGFRVWRGEGHLLGMYVILGASAGAVAGCVVYVMDLVRDQAEGPPATRLGAVLGVLSILTCWLPFLGLLLGGIASWVNRGTSGWPRTTSWIGAGIAALFTVITGAAVISMIGK